jgi:hypothetical protein
MTRGATDVKSGVKDCLKQRPMSRNLELRGKYRQHFWFVYFRIVELLIHYISESCQPPTRWIP